MLAHQVYRHPNLLIIHFKLLGSHVSNNSNPMDDDVHGLFLNNLRPQGGFFFLTAVTLKSPRSLSPSTVYWVIFMFGANYLQCV